MPPMHKFLMEKAEWYETCMQRRAAELGFRHMKPSMVMIMKNMIVGQPARMALLAQRAGTTRRRISQIAAEGVELGVLELVEDPHDKRVLLVKLSAAGEEVGHAAVDSMRRIEAELAQRIGRANLDKLTEILAMDWGLPEVREPGAPAKARRSPAPRAKAPPRKR
jgi:DNA-binding MarR family transcriptional regulator